MMNSEEIKNMVAGVVIPNDVHPLLKALIIEARGDWETAHKIVQEHSTRDAAWVHAYLHRKEGDIGNSKYWYSKANRPFEICSFNDEWNKLAAYFGNID